MKRAVLTDKAPKPVAPYSQAVDTGNMIFVSGQVGLNPTTGKLEENFEDEVRRCLDNLMNILQEAGYSADDVVKTTVFLSDLSLFSTANEIYKRYFPNVKPARSCVGAALAIGAKVEIEAIAVKG